MAPRKPRGYVCYQAAGPIQIDGRLDEPAWQRAPWTEDFADIEGPIKPRPRFRTRAKMLWDEENFYVAAELEEPHVWGTQTQHDSVIFRDNDFEVFIDPNGDNHEYYEFEMNALNTTWDLLLKKPYKDGGSAINEWEIRGLRTAVRVRGTLNNPDDVDRGWTVEIAFPWKALAEYAHRPAPPLEGDQWRVDFSRVEWPINVTQGRYEKIPGRREDNWVWSPTGIVDMHRPERWGYVQFSRRPPPVRFRPDPTGPARDLLQEIYYAERDFQQRRGRWAASLAELGLRLPALPPSVRSVGVASTENGFAASADLNLARPRHLHIRQDSLVWSD
ncbi:MAG: carbohydrate-binding family 9-like protein [Verrucomicrobia bacterium]|nr:carbohydrate-binding family 9-like protein [Verrucomicrobiota bacterium]